MLMSNLVSYFERILMFFTHIPIPMLSCTTNDDENNNDDNNNDDILDNFADMDERSYRHVSKSLPLLPKP